MQRAEDVEILELASAEDRIIVSEDTHFGALLAQSGAIAPSFVLLRGSEPVTPEGQISVLLANLPALENDLAKGAIVVFSRGRIRIRPIPVRPQE